MSSLLEDLQQLAGVLAPHEQPNPAELPALVGAVVKVLEDGGVTVADHLLNPPAPVEESAPAPAEASALQDLIARAEAAVAKLEGTGSA
jgi:hypothetical protein